MAGRSKAIDTVRGLYAIIDTAYVPPGKAGAAARSVLRSGARLIQLRAKGTPPSLFLAAAREVRREAGEHGALFIVNDRVDVALLSGADGVHLGQDDIPVPEARRLLGEGALVGLSTHNFEEAEEAERLGADYISFGPVFPTRTKKDADAVKGIERLRDFTGKVRLPVVAIGGITADNIRDVIAAGARAGAVISDIFSYDDPASRVSLILARLSG